MTWLDRARAAIAELGDAALCGASALRAVDGPGRRDHDDAGPIHVAVEPGGAVTAPAGVVLHRRAQLGRRADWQADPPRMYVEEALLDLVAVSTDPIGALHRLRTAVHAGMTSPDALALTLARRPRLPRRRLIRRVLTRLDAERVPQLVAGGRPTGRPPAI